MENPNTGLAVREDAVAIAACSACMEMPAQLLCPACELDVPCDRCGGTVAYRSLGTTALLCAACTRLDIEETETPASRVALWLHRAISAGTVAGVVAIEWVAFSPSWSRAGITLNGTLTDIGAVAGLGVCAAFFIGHGVVEHVWPEGRRR